LLFATAGKRMVWEAAESSTDGFYICCIPPPA
jgi:hypothetical protein